MNFYTDRNSEAQIRNVQYISKDIWHGIRALILNNKDKNGLSINFPELDGTIPCGCNIYRLNSAIHSVIPRIEDIETYDKYENDITPFDDESDNEKRINADKNLTSDVLDLIEFVYSRLHDFSILDYHKSGNYSLLTPINGSKMKDSFREDINDIFRRNSLIYELNTDGEIERVIPAELEALFRVSYNTKDSELNELLDLAYKKFLSRQVEERKLGLEKLWDAFERLKTIECKRNQNKKVSAECVLAKLGNNNNEFVDKILREEMITLTNIGNDFRIRHHETNKTEIVDSAHVDYLFYRMMAFINLFLDKYNIK